MRTPRGYASVDAVRLRRLPPLFWLGLAGYVTLTVLVAVGALDAFDRSVLNFCRNHTNGTLAAAANHFTDVFSPAVDVAILLAALGLRALRRQRPELVVPGFVTAGVMAGIVVATKDALGRPLPNTRHLEHADGFPSGHTAMFLVCFGTLVLLTTRRHPRRQASLLSLVGVGTALVAASLVYDGFHWLTDTLASMSLGVAVLSLLRRWISRRTASRRSAADTPPIGRTARRH
jgi:membrane-associated phospholipid phosphatase